MYSPTRLIILLCSLFLPFSAVCGSDWLSPHDLKAEEKAPVSLIPFPEKVTWGSPDGKKSLVLTPGNSLIVQCKGDSSLYENALRALEHRLGIKPLPADKGTLILEQDPALEKKYGREGYLLTINGKEALLKAASDAGLFYGIQTLGQLVRKNVKGALIAPTVTIEDKPAFAYRGFMHDTGRNYQTLESLKEQLDKMSQFKINVFQWHLTDNPAWRPESRIYPQLSDPKNHTKNRDEGKIYTFDQIRDLIAFAKERHILIIPELDMPGHSAFFKKTFGFDMASPEGMDVLENLLDEFCKEIPKKDCPILHIGTDEVHIKNPGKFVRRMVAKVRSLGRTPVQWKPGLPMEEGDIAQLWSEGDPVTRPDNKNTPYFDSGFGYVNLIDSPHLLVQRYFFKQLGGRPQGDEQALGPILCLWPDVRVDDKAKIQRHNMQWPAVLVFAERAWKGAPRDGSAYGSALPPRGTEARLAFDQFEKRMLTFRHDFPSFPYFKASQLSWKVTRPVATKDTGAVEKTRSRMLAAQPGLPLTSVEGGNLILRSRMDGEGLYPSQAPGATVWARMELNAPRAGKQAFLVGFDAPRRSSRKSSGIPQNGQWSSFGAKLWVNGQETNGPDWENPGKYKYEKDTWFAPANEIPYTDEEFWWTRIPVELNLKKGINTIVAEIPYEGAYQSWGVCLIPVKKEGHLWVADERISSPS